MATKKTTTKKAEPKQEKVLYRDKEYTVLERGEQRVCLTDGLIHFWVRAKDVEAD